MGLLDQFFGTPEQTQALGVLGAGLMAGRPAAGFENALGLLSPDSQLKRQMGLLQMQQAQMSTDEMRRKLADDEATRKVLQGVYGQQGMPQSPMPQGMAPPPSFAAPGDGVGPMPEQPPMQQGVVTPKADVWQQYKMIGDKLASQGLVTQAQQYYGMAEKMRPKYNTTPQVVRDPTTGKLINALVSEDGSVQPLQYGVKPDMVMENLGGTVRAIDKNALNGGESFGKTVSPDTVYSGGITLRGQNMTDARAQKEYDLKAATSDPFGTLGINTKPAGGGAMGSGVTGPAVLDGLNPQISAQVKALAEGRMAFPGGFALKSPYWQNMIALVSQYDPTFDAVNYNKRNQTASAFSKGKQGDAVRAANQTLSHMGNLSNSIDTLDNFNGVATPLNYVVNPLEKAFGDTRQGTFQQTVQAVSSELRKVFSSGGVGNLQELKQWEDSLPMNASKEQQKAYLKNGTELLQGALDALDNQYRAGMGPKASISDLITPKARGVLNKISGGGQSAGAGATPLTNTQGWVLHTDAQGNKAYVSPDGKQFQQVQ